MTFPGTVKTFQADKNFGFILMDDGMELFVHGKACNDGKTLQVGDKVMFDLEDSTTKPGEYMAGNVSGGSGTPGGGGQWGAAAGGWNAGGGGAAAGGWGGGGGASWGGAAATAGTGSNTGMVSKYSPEKGFGFLQGADGSNYFFHLNQVVDGRAPNVGDALTFDLEPSPLKPGQMQASNIAGGTGAGKGGGGKACGKGFGGKGGAAATAGTGSMTGMVAKFNPEKGFGFVQGADGTSYFFHQKQFVDGSAPNEGDTLTFELEPSPLKPGQMQACNIRGGSGAGKGGGGKACGKGASYGAAQAGGGNGAAGPYGMAAAWPAQAGW